jgi:prepilin-type processing-associated H-X9-DG protein
MTSVPELNAYLGNFFNGGFVVMNHNYWVQRKPPVGFFGGGLPDPAYTVASTDPATFGWPGKTTDRAAGNVPIISDGCFSGYSGQAGTKNVSDINTSFANNSPLPAAQKYSGHCVGTKLTSVNLVFADGHVSLRTTAFIQCVYYNTGTTGSPGWFY